MKRMIKSAEEVQSDESVPLVAGTCYVIQQTDAQHASTTAQRYSIRYAKIVKTTNNYVIYDQYSVQHGYLDPDYYGVKQSKKNFIRSWSGNGKYLCFASEDELFNVLNIDPNKEFNVAPGTVFSSFTANSQGRNSMMFTVFFTVVLDVSYENDKVVCREYKYCDEHHVGRNMYKDFTYSIGAFAQQVSSPSIHEYSSLQEFVNETGLDIDVIHEASEARLEW